MFFTDAIIQDIVEHTNSTYEVKLKKEPVRDQRWYSLDKVELLKYIGISIMMGLVLNIYLPQSLDNIFPLCSE
jgi:hypothetical protein